MMLTTLLLLLCLAGHVFAEELPDVNCSCLVIDLKYVQCTWNKLGTPEVNYTFSGWFHNENVTECPSYLTENGINIGCTQPYGDRINRFLSFHTRRVDGNTTFKKEHDLKSKVKLDPPFKLTVKMGPDNNLWFYWNQTSASCVESDIRYRINNNKWDFAKVSTGRQSYCINLPSNSSLYELQVRGKLGNTCGESEFWSDWSEPVVWGSNNSTDTNQSMSVWTPVLFVLGTITLILLVMMLLHHERLRVILIPVVPKPSLISHDIQDWLQLSKGQSFKANYNERACPVREYFQVPQDNSESSDSSASSVTTDQTDCSVSIPADLSTSCFSSASRDLASSEEAGQV